MAKVTTQTETNSLKIGNADNKIILSMDGKKRFPMCDCNELEMKLTKRQVNKIINDLKSALANCG